MYFKEMYFHEGQNLYKGKIRSYTEKDIPALIQVQKESFPPPFPADLWWNEEQLKSHITRFADGALCVEVEGEMAGSITGVIVDLKPGEKHTWEEITDNGYIRNHIPAGNTLYVVDICVQPKFRKLGLGKWLMMAMYEVVVHHKLERLAGGGRMPGYHKVADQMSADSYIAKVTQGELKDPVISFLLRCGRMPVEIIENYLEDEESLNHAVLMEWRNPFTEHNDKDKKKEQ